MLYLDFFPVIFYCCGLYDLVIELVGVPPVPDVFRLSFVAIGSPMSILSVGILARGAPALCEYCRTEEEGLLS